MALNLTQLRHALAENRPVILTAPPGTGKTTTIPPSGLTAETFRRRSSFVQFTKEDLAETREAIETFGKLEGLDAHAYAATVRFES